MKHHEETQFRNKGQQGRSIKQKTQISQQNSPVKHEEEREKQKPLICESSPLHEES
jgi:hypothetical protein